MKNIFNSAKIGNKIVGDGEPCFITLEAGPTHDGIESAMKLAKVAADSGADAVKFQIFDPDRLVADKKMPFSYDILIDKNSGKTETISEPLYDILTRRALSESEWIKLKSYCDEIGIMFFATVSDDSYFSMIERMALPSLKVASADVDHTPFLKNLAKLDTCIQLDTGNATLGEVETAVDIFRKGGCENYIIHNCPSGYPARLDSINLKLLKTIKQVFNCPAAFSDHTPGWEMDVAALAMGANLLEKTISLDRLTPSVEHIMSLEPEDVDVFIKVIRDVETAMGQSRRILDDVELSKRKMIRRSVYLSQNVMAGQSLSEAKVEFRRPGIGLTPEQYELYQSATFNRNIEASELVDLSDLNISKAS